MATMFPLMRPNRVPRPLKKTVRGVLVLAVLTLLISATPAQALPIPLLNGDEPWRAERLILRVGIFRPNIDTNIRLDGSAAPIGTDVDFERDLGLEDSKTELFADFTLRITKRQRLEVGYLRLNRDATKTLTQTINYGDQSFTAGTDVTTVLDVNIYRVAYGYSILNTGRKEFGFTIGLHATSIDAGINDTGGSISEQGDMIMPLPNFGVFGGVAIGSHVAALGRVQIFYLEAGQYRAELVNATAAVEYYPFKPLFLGAGYTIFDLGGEADTGSFSGEFDFQFHGPIAYAGLRF